MPDRVKRFTVIQCNHDHVLVRGEELDDSMQDIISMQLLLTQSAGIQGGLFSTVARKCQSLEMYYDSIQFTTTTIKVTFLCCRSEL